MLDAAVNDDDDIITYRLMVKGAPEELIRNCDTIIIDNGTMETLTDEHLVKFEVSNSFSRKWKTEKLCVNY